MSLFLLISILLRVAALSWLCWRLWGRCDWRIRLTAAVLALMTLRQLVLLYGELVLAERWTVTLFCEPGELPALAASVGAFFLALAADLVLTGPPTESPTDVSVGRVGEVARVGRRLGRSGVWASMLVGALAMVFSVLIGYFAYNDSRKAIVSAVATRNRTAALTLIRHVEAELPGVDTPRAGRPVKSKKRGSRARKRTAGPPAPSGDDDVGSSALRDESEPDVSAVLGQRALRLIERHWELISRDMPRSRLCVIRWPGVVALHTRYPELVGKDVRRVVVGGIDEEPTTVADLLRRERSWLGETFDLGGHKQIAAYVYMKPIRCLVGVNVPASVVEPRIERMARPWGYGMLLVVGILLPLAFGLLHYSYRSAELASQAAMRALVESEERTRTLLELLPDGVQRCDLTGRITYSNAAHSLMHGYQPGELVGWYIWDVKPTEEERRELREFFERLVREQPEPRPVFGRDLTKNGRIIHVQVDWAYERDQNGNLTGFVAVISDITERQRAERALRESEERFRTLCESAPVGIFLADRHCQWVYVNPVCVELTGLKPEQLLGEGWLQAVHPDDRARVAEQWRRACLDGLDYLEENRVLSPDGTQRWLQFWTISRRDDEGRVVGYVGTLMDVTKRREAEQTLQRLAERLHVLSRQLLEAQETERRRIATDLHDQIGQSLTALKVNLQSLRRSQPGQANVAHWTTCLTLLDQVIQQVRDLSRNLRPSVLDDLGLIPALQWLLKSQVNGRLNAYLETNLGQERLPPHIETAVFRIVQEAANNCLKHAGASRLEVRIRATEDTLVVDIEDDGRGFNVDRALQRAARGHSLGLLGMQERVLLLNGQIEIESERGKGTRIHLEIPLSRAQVLTE